MQGFILSHCDGGSEGSGNSVCRNSFGCESGISSRGEVGSIGDDVRLVEVEIVEILVRVRSCKEDACDKQSDSCDGAAQFGKACPGGINGCHVEKASFVSSERPEMWLSSLGLWSSSNVASLRVSKPEITGFHSDKVGCEEVKFSSESLTSVWLQVWLSLVRSSESQVSSSSLSEK